MPIGDSELRSIPEEYPRPDNRDQIRTEGRIHRGPRSDYITFRLNFYLCQLFFIVTIPEEGTQKAPVYVRFALRPNTRG